MPSIHDVEVRSLQVNADERLILPPPDGANRLREGSCIRETMATHGIESEDVALVTTLNATTKEDSSTIFLHTYLVYGRLYMKAPDSPAVYTTREAAHPADPRLIIDIEGSYVANQTTTGPSPTVLLREQGEYVRVCGESGSPSND
ncbi:MAG: hypothetical protein ABEJ89_06180 [Haloarculaceae archaeon]